MPFTLAHAAAAPPLRRLLGRWLPLSGLVVGSMSPDFEYLVHLSTRRTIGHTPVGVLVLCLPASLAVLLVFHRVVERPLLRLVPSRWAHLAAAADEPFRFSPFPRFLAVCASAVLGAASHVAWDSFTHRGGWAVRRVPALRATLVSVGGYDVVAYKALQYLSGVLGVVLLAAWLAGWARRQPHGATAAEVLPARSRRRVLAAIAAAAGAGGVLNAARTAFGAASPEAADPKAVLVGGVLGILVGLCAAVVVYGAASVRPRPRPPGVH